MRFTFLSFVTLAVAAVAAQPTRPLNPPQSMAKHVVWTPAQPGSIEPATNAKRLAQGLPLKPPTRRRPHRGGPHRDGSYNHGVTHVAAAPRAQTSPSPTVQQSCHVLVTDASGNGLGYVSPSWNSFGEYGATQASQEGSLLASFSYPPDSPSQLLFTASNSPDGGYPFVGGVLGFSSDSPNFGPGEFSYAYLAGTTKTDPGSPAVSGDSSYSQASGLDDGMESAIWTYNPATRDITPQWVNDDGSQPTTYIFIIDDVFILTGDPEVASALGDAKEVRFTCLPPILAPVRL